MHNTADKVKILFLYSHVMGYTYACIKKLKELYHFDVTLIFYKENPQSPYKIPSDCPFPIYIKEEKLLNELAKQSFNLVYIPGWLDKDYLEFAKRQKKKGAIIVAGSDTQWKGSLRQWMGTIYGRFYLKRVIDYFWVPGVYQYEFIRKFGYHRNKILFNLYCADTELFNDIYQKHQKEVKHNLLFVGRFVEVKGISLLVEAFLELKAEMKNDWKLIMVGNGPLRKDITGADIETIDFQQPTELKKIVNNSGVFVLPSTYEPWGVVVHEFSAVGLPLLISDACGSHIQFLKNGYNGFLFESGVKASLKKYLKKIMLMSDDKLKEMGARSNAISKTINTEVWSAVISSLLK